MKTISLIKKISEQTKYSNQESWWLLEKLTNKKKSDLLVSDINLTSNQEQQLKLWIDDIVLRNKPLQYILGSVPFCDINVLVEPPILIPRPETEYICSWLIKNIKDEITILDLCCGTGCIALSLAKALPQTKVLGVDIDPRAITLSLKNKEFNHITNAEFIVSDLYANLFGTNTFGTFDLIISNPPYVTEDEWNKLDRQITSWENKKSLVAQDNGLEFYKKILSNRPVTDTKIVFEIGESQGQAVANLLKEYGFSDIEIHKDLSGKDRFTTGCFITGTNK